MAAATTACSCVLDLVLDDDDDDDDEEEEEEEEDDEECEEDELYSEYCSVSDLIRVEAEEAIYSTLDGPHQTLKHIVFYAPRVSLSPAKECPRSLLFKPFGARAAPCSELELAVIAQSEHSLVLRCRMCAV